ncbi:MAG TPA: hypothetical protein VII76_15340 [Acidimicrobiales bacterium]
MTNGLMDVATGMPDTQLPEGTPVDVRNRFVGSWSHGFEVAERAQGGYRVRRLSDDSVLPDVFPSEDVRSERRKQGLWWY